MKLTTDQAHARLLAHDHGVLCTVHATRGVDAVPVVYAMADDHVGVPIDHVKAKTSRRLQRERNLQADPRATLLIEQWDRADWSKLWWARAELHWQGEDSSLGDTMSDRLAQSFPQYHDKPFSGLLIFRIVAVTGWSARTDC